MYPQHNFGFQIWFSTSEVISRRCLLVAVVLWPMCCHTGMSCHRHRTQHSTLSQYTDTGPTCRCAIHWCGTSHWNTQLPILMSWVRPDLEILPDLPHTPANAQFYDAVIVVVSQKLGRKCTVPTEVWTRDLWCANPLRYPLTHSCFSKYFCYFYEMKKKDCLTLAVSAVYIIKMFM